MIERGGGVVVRIGIGGGDDIENRLLLFFYVTAWVTKECVGKSQFIGEGEVSQSSGGCWCT
jgi:hypothetical protein